MNMRSPPRDLFMTSPAIAIMPIGGGACPQTRAEIFPITSDNQYVNLNTAADQIDTIPIDGTGHRTAHVANLACVLSRNLATPIREEIAVGQSALKAAAASTRSPLNLRPTPAACIVN